MKFVRPSDSTAMKRLVEDLERSELTYGDIGATLDGNRPEGFHHDHYETVLGRGSETFQRAVTGLKTWEAHHLPGVRVFPHDQEIRTGATVIVTLGTSVVALAAPCRIVRVVEEQTRWGFAYGTLLWASPGLTDIHHQVHSTREDAHHGHHGEEEAPSPPVVHPGVQGRDRRALQTR